MWFYLQTMNVLGMKYIQEAAHAYFYIYKQLLSMLSMSVLQHRSHIKTLV